jgi:hypothetical protein
MSVIDSNSTITVASEVSNMAITVVIGALIVVLGGIGLHWFYKRNYKKAKHSARLVDKFFNPWLTGITRYNNNYCKIGACYSEKFDKMIPLEPKEPKEQSNHRFYYEVMNNPKKYNQLLKDWKNLKEITLELNKELANFCEDIRVIVKDEINLPYWCRHPSNEPHKYLCYDAFTESIYEEVKYTFETEYTEKHGIGMINETNFPDEKVYSFRWGESYLAASPEKERMEKTQRLFSQFIGNKKHKEIIKALWDKQKETYDIALEKVKADIENIIESIELDNIVEEKVQHIVNPF